MQAREHLDAVVRFLREMGVREPCVIPIQADAIEARIGTGDLDGAAKLLVEFEELGRASGREWALAVAARCRALLAIAFSPDTGGRAAVERRTDEALAEIDEAFVHLGRVDSPFERARTSLARGTILRRAQRRRAARDALDEALEAFESLGTPLWTAKARAELARIGGRRSVGDGLSSTEQRIAELVAEGKTNKEVAAVLVLAERTVESALTQIYRKLDVRSRTELARKLAG
jgi:DNA-binding CsgD family transcriptional regulator